MAVYAKMSTIYMGLAFIYTGASNGGHFEVDLPPGGQHAHGFAASDIPTDYTISVDPAPVELPCYVTLSQDVSAGDELTVDSSGKCKGKGPLDTLNAEALTSGLSGDPILAIRRNI
jgi:hypothetical protein